eukprot:TRINITY_DN1829_c0_g1_i6.p1 TRINITY_DN1829_c0_g1~~TRINITY_DN1829_c0_g1_i6.p1  ORF type:complete len:165 (-),score=49.36 TRINITY_DN1829_c0_g1_i6:122-544(-)
MLEEEDVRATVERFQNRTPACSKGSVLIAESSAEEEERDVAAASTSQGGPSEERDVACASTSQGGPGLLASRDGTREEDTVEALLRPIREGLGVSSVVPPEFAEEDFAEEDCFEGGEEEEAFENEAITQEQRRSRISLLM